ncbi:hypothetical protein PIB30_094334, partial [Stylosanthes scabra]|nr:hypothetical protein [Stylosanthes scabra]
MHGKGEGRHWKQRIHEEKLKLLVMFLACRLATLLLANVAHATLEAALATLLLANVAHAISASSRVACATPYDAHGTYTSAGLKLKARIGISCLGAKTKPP